MTKSLSDNNHHPNPHSGANTHPSQAPEKWLPSTSVPQPNPKADDSPEPAGLAPSESDYADVALPEDAILTSLGLTVPLTYEVVADEATGTLIPVVKRLSTSWQSETRLGLLQAEDGTWVLRPQTVLQAQLQAGRIPGREQAYLEARHRGKSTSLVLGSLGQNDIVTVHCMCAGSPKCRRTEKVTVAAVRLHSKKDPNAIAVREDRTVAWICGECCRRASSDAQALALVRIQEGRSISGNPLGTIQATELPARWDDPTTMPAVRWDWDRGVFGPARPWTPEMGYTAGVILGDGSITRDWVTIELGEKDRDILETVAQTVGIPADAIRTTVRQTKTGPSRTATLKLCGRGAVSDLLLRLCLAGPGAKHHTISVPHSLPDDFLPDFLRGLVDTDGTVVAPHGRSPQIVLYTNSLPLLRQLQARVGPILGSPRLGAIHEAACRGTHMWTICGHEAISLTGWLWPEIGWVGGSRKAREAERKILAWIPRRAPRAKAFLG